jgi:hypothetical protein
LKTSPPPHFWNGRPTGTSRANGPCQRRRERPDLHAWLARRQCQPIRHCFRLRCGKQPTPLQPAPKA